MRKQLMWLVFDAAGCAMTLTCAMWGAFMGWHAYSLGLLLTGVVVAVVLHRDYQSLSASLDAHEALEAGIRRVLERRSA